MQYGKAGNGYYITICIYIYIRRRGRGQFDEVGEHLRGPRGVPGVPRQGRRGEVATPRDATGTSSSAELARWPSSVGRKQCRTQAVSDASSVGPRLWHRFTFAGVPLRRGEGDLRHSPDDQVGILGGAQVASLPVLQVHSLCRSLERRCRQGRNALPTSRGHGSLVDTCEASIPSTSQRESSWQD